MQQATFVAPQSSEHPVGTQAINTRAGEARLVPSKPWLTRSQEERFLSLPTPRDTDLRRRVAAAPTRPDTVPHAAGGRGVRVLPSLGDFRCVRCAPRGPRLCRAAPIRREVG